jgi:transcriptional regulator with XRE-family HTH domain
MAVTKTNPVDSRLPWLAHLPSALKTLRQRSGLSVSEVATVARQRSGSGMTPAQITLWENGKRVPSLRTLLAFLDAIEANFYALADALPKPSLEHFHDDEFQQLTRGSELSLASLDRRLTALDLQVGQLRKQIAPIAQTSS